MWCPPQLHLGLQRLSPCQACEVSIAYIMATSMAPLGSMDKLLSLVLWVWGVGLISHTAPWWVSQNFLCISQFLHQPPLCAIKLQDIPAHAKFLAASVKGGSSSVLFWLRVLCFLCVFAFSSRRKPQVSSAYRKSWSTGQHTCRIPSSESQWFAAFPDHFDKLSYFPKEFWIW